MRTPLRHRTFDSLPISALALALSVGASAAPGPGGCEDGSWIAGQTSLCNGALVYRDYVLDDYGAAGGGTHRWNGGVLSEPIGGARYPEDQDVVSQIKYADLVMLKLWIDGGELHVSAELNALFDAGTTFVAIAIDTDDDPLTGGGPWPGVLASANGGVTVPLVSAGWDLVHVFEHGDPDTTTIDTAANVIAGSIPLPPVSGSTWRVQAVTGLRAQHNVFNVAFRTSEDGVWFDQLQATALSAAAGGDISAFGHTLAVADLLGGTTAPFVPGPGFYERVYVSDYTVAEQPPGSRNLVYDSGAEGYVNGNGGQGIYGVPGRRSAAGLLGQWFSSIGRYQPYGLYLPASPAPHGLQVVLHGLSQTHTTLVDQPNMQLRFGDEQDRVLVAPLGRGPYGFYSDISERDVFDVIADAQANYAIDPERMFVSGYSMGGYGTFFLSTLFPDLFAGWVAWVGYPGDGCLRTALHNQCPNGGPSNAYEFFENTEHTPGAMLFASADELVNAQQGEAVRERFAELPRPVEHVWYLHEGDHFTLMAADDWRKEAAWSSGRTRETQPAHLRYRSEPWIDNEELGLAHDGAWWVDGIVGRGRGAEDEYVDVDLQSWGCGGSADDVGVAFPASAGGDPVPWTSQEGTVDGQTTLAVENRLEGTLLNVASLRVDGGPGGACIAPGTPLAYSITTDGDTEILIRGEHYRLLRLVGAGTHTGLLPEPSRAAGLAAALALLGWLARRRTG